MDFICPPIFFIDVQALSSQITPATGVEGIEVSHVCANGADGSGGYIWQGDDGSPGASDAGLIDAFLGVRFRPGSPLWNGLPWIMGDDAHGIFAGSRGGDGGDGQGVAGWTGAAAFGGDGGNGGDGTTVFVISKGAIETIGDAAGGIFAESQGGIGGDGGYAYTAVYAEGGDGGIGGSGGPVGINNSGSIVTSGAFADGIVGQSLGGAGGNGGEGGSAFGQGGGALGSGPGENVSVSNYGDIWTSGEGARGIFIQSVGGHTGKAAGAYGVWAWGGSGASAGNGGATPVYNEGAITTAGAAQIALLR